MQEEIVWWQSRTIWTGIVGTAAALVGGFVHLPDGMTVDLMVDAIVGVTSVLAIVFRAKATASIAPVVTTN